MNNVLINYFQQLEQQSGGVLGVSALHLESGQQVSYKSDELFLLCSTYKIPIAICLLRQVERGLIALNDLITVFEDDLRPGSDSFLLELNYDAEVRLSVLNLLKLMMQYSCNSSTDIIIKLIGGTATVMDMLKDLGIKNCHVNTTTLRAIAYWDGIIGLPPDEKLTMSEYKKMEAMVDPALREKMRENLKEGIKDWGSPASMVELLKKFINNEIVKSEYVELLLKIMSHCKTGPNRMMSKLPKNTLVARKTGTLTGFVNEVSVIQLPFDGGQLILNIYIKNSDQSVPCCESIIAETARLIFDYYIFNVPYSGEKKL